MSSHFFQDFMNAEKFNIKSVTWFGGHPVEYTCLYLLDRFQLKSIFPEYAGFSKLFVYCHNLSFLKLDEWLAYGEGGTQL